MKQDPLTEDQIIKALGERIKSLRIQHGKTQQQIADLAGMEESAYRRLELGKTNPTVKTLYKVSTSLGVHLSAFFIDSIPSEI